MISTWLANGTTCLDNWSKCKEKNDKDAIIPSFGDDISMLEKEFIRAYLRAQKHHHYRPLQQQEQLGSRFYYSHLWKLASLSTLRPPIHWPPVAILFCLVLLFYQPFRFWPIWDGRWCVCMHIGTNSILLFTLVLHSVGLYTSWNVCYNITKRKTKVLFYHLHYVLLLSKMFQLLLKTFGF